MACVAVISAPLPNPASTISTPEPHPATMRFRIGKVCESAVTSIENSVTTAPEPGDLFRQQLVFTGIEIQQSGTEHRNGSPLGRKRPLVSRRIDPARKPTHYREARIGELVGKLLGTLQPVMARSPRTDHADRVRIPRLKFAPDVEHDRRRSDLPQQRWIFRRILRNHRCPKIRDALEFGRQVNKFLPFH